MGDTYVISGLVKKRAELSGEVEVLRQQMIALKGEISTIDNAIHLFDPTYNVKSIKAIRKRTANRFFEPGERSRAIVDTLREANGEGLSIREIATELCKQRGLDLQDQDFDRMVATLNDGVRSVASKGTIEVVSRANGTPRYVIKLD